MVGSIYVHKLIMVDSTFDVKNTIEMLSKKYTKIAFDYAKDRDIINFKYCQKNVVFNNNTIVSMFKATMTDSVLQEANKNSNEEKNLQAMKTMWYYYAYETKDNNLSSVLKNNPVKIIPIDSSHDNCFSNDNVLKKIAYECMLN